MPNREQQTPLAVAERMCRSGECERHKSANVSSLLACKTIKQKDVIKDVICEFSNRWSKMVPYAQR